jgi:hypothetical protein
VMHFTMFAPTFGSSICLADTSNVQTALCHQQKLLEATDSGMTGSHQVQQLTRQPEHQQAARGSQDNKRAVGKLYMYYILASELTLCY